MLEAIPFGPIYPYTPGTYVGLAFWWILIISVIVSIVVAKKSK